MRLSDQSDFTLVEFGCGFPRSCGGCTFAARFSVARAARRVAHFAGPFTRVGTQERLKAITDGLSKTIFFGEVRPKCSEHVRNGWVNSNNGNGYCTTLIPINYDTCNDASPDPCHRSNNWTTEVGFKSAHSGGALFLFGDGNVQFLPEEIDHSTYQLLGAKNDGQAIRPF